jgi:hypothetical protein
LLSKWSTGLLQSGTSTSLELLIQFLIAGGAELAATTPGILERLQIQVEATADPTLIQSHRSLTELVGGGIPSAEQNEKELQDEGLKQSPSIDRELSAQYGTLFKRSSSVPLELSEMGDVNDGQTVAAAVSQYSYSQDLHELLNELKRLGYREGDTQAAIDLLRAVVEMPVDRQMVASPVVLDVFRAGFYNEEEVRAAVRAVAAECGAEPAKARKLVRIFAKLVAEEVAAFDHFEELFASLKPIWGGIIPEFLEQLDQIRGEWIDDIMESEFWRNAKFLGVESIFEKLEKLKEWEIVGFLPKYEIVSLFADSSREGKMDPDLLFQEDLGVDQKEIAPLIFEILTGIGEIPSGAAPALKRWFQKHKDIVGQLAERFGEAGARIASILQ